MSTLYTGICGYLSLSFDTKGAIALPAMQHSHTKNRDSERRGGGGASERRRRGRGRRGERGERDGRVGVLGWGAKAGESSWKLGWASLVFLDEKRVRNR